MLREHELPTLLSALCSAPEGCGACTALAVVVLAFFLAVARLTRMGRLDRKWPFISVSALSRSLSWLSTGRGGARERGAAADEKPMLKRGVAGRRQQRSQQSVRLMWQCWLPANRACPSSRPVT